MSGQMYARERTNAFREIDPFDVSDGFLNSALSPRDTWRIEGETDLVAPVVMMSPAHKRRSLAGNGAPRRCSPGRCPSLPAQLMAAALAASTGRGGRRPGAASAETHRHVDGDRQGFIPCQESSAVCSIRVVHGRWSERRPRPTVAAADTGRMCGALRGSIQIGFGFRRLHVSSLAQGLRSQRHRIRGGVQVHGLHRRCEVTQEMIPSPP